MLDKRKRPGWLARKLKAWWQALADRLLRRVERSGRKRGFFERFEEALSGPGENRNSIGAMRARWAEIEALSREETLRFVQEENSRLAEELRQVREERDGLQMHLESKNAQIKVQRAAYVAVARERDAFAEQKREAFEMLDALIRQSEKVRAEVHSLGMRIDAEHAKRKQAIEATAEAFERGRGEIIEPGMPIGELLGFSVVEKVGMKSPDLSGAYLRQVPPPPDAHKRGG